MLIKFFFFFLTTLGFQTSSMNLVNESNPKENSFNEKWNFISDEVMGGVSSGKLEIISDMDSFFYRLNGSVSTQNNGGFIQFRSKIELDKDEFKGLRLTLRGIENSYFVHITTTYTFLPWQYYSFKVDVDESWRTIDIPFDNFKKSHAFQPLNFKSDQIKTIGFVAKGNDFNATLDIKKIYLF